MFKNQDDKEIKKIIEQDSFTNELIVHDVNIKSLHRNFYRSRTDQNFRNKYKQQLDHIESKYIKSINKSSSDKNKFSYDYNQKIHKKVIEPRNKECQSQIRDMSKYENIGDFLIAIDDKLKNMKKYKLK
jgi:hypothetical protein